MKNLVLFGFMGTGKTLIANMMKKRLGLRRVDMDDRIEIHENKSISKIFAEDGEPYFRSCEQNIAAQLASENDLIISTGGGVVLNKENVLNLAQNGVCICLNASAETIFDRVKNETHRPLLCTENPLATIKSILVQRKPFYDAVPFQVTTDGKTPQEICDEIESIFKANQ